MSEGRSTNSGLILAAIITAILGPLILYLGIRVIDTLIPPRAEATRSSPTQVAIVETAIASNATADRQVFPTSAPVIAATETPSQVVSQPIPIIPTATQIVVIPTAESFGPLRDHQAVSIGAGVFANATFSDGLAPYTENWLWENNHFNIQRIRREEQPSGCDTSGYEASKVWFGAGSQATVTVNGAEVGTITLITPKQRHGYIVDLTLYVNDQICMSPIPASGFHIIFGPDVYYHYDSYCYRGNC